MHRVRESRAVEEARLCKRETDAEVAGLSDDKALGKMVEIAAADAAAMQRKLLAMRAASSARAEAR